MNYQKAIEIANHWRVSQGNNQMTDGVVLVYADKVYGWQSTLREPSHERPGALAIDARGAMWEAIGGTAQDGAEEWDEIERPLLMANPRRRMGFLADEMEVPDDFDTMAAGRIANLFNIGG